MRASTRPGIEELYREHALGLVRFALLLTGDRATAEDVVQDAFLGLHRHWDEVRDPDRLAAYLRTAVVNGSRSRHRRRLAAMRLRPEPLALVQSAEASVLAGEDRRALLAAVDALPRRQRDADVAGAVPGHRHQPVPVGRRKRARLLQVDGRQ